MSQENDGNRVAAAFDEDQIEDLAERREKCRPGITLEPGEKRPWPKLSPTEFASPLRRTRSDVLAQLLGPQFLLLLLLFAQRFLNFLLPSAIAEIAIS